MYNSIVLSCTLFGSVYIFSKSVELINQSLLQDKQIPDSLVVINTLSFVVSGSIIIYSLALSNIK